MGLFDQLLGGIVGKLGTPEQRDSLMNLATSVIRDHPGGLAGVVQQFSGAGLAEQVKSWVGTGQNLPVSADQLIAAIGPDRVKAMSQKLGVSSETASAGLAALLPAIIDHLTPTGRVEHGTDLKAALDAVKSKA
jgi:uncharacterized protein YidB (DUF937 family)